MIAALVLVMGELQSPKPPLALSPMKSTWTSRGKPSISLCLTTTLQCTAVAPAVANEKPSPHSLPHDK